MLLFDLISFSAVCAGGFSSSSEEVTFMSYVSLLGDQGYFRVSLFCSAIVGEKGEPGITELGAGSC